MTPVTPRALALAAALTFSLISGTATGALADSGTVHATPSLPLVAHMTANAASNPFALASLPGAEHTIYLNFTGETLTNSIWNADARADTITLDPYSTDKNTLSFTKNERADIRHIWESVSEDFAPFNVNVTTIAPSDQTILGRDSEDDTVFGAEAIITQMNNPVANTCRCGGYSFVGTFGQVGDPTPAFAFSDGNAWDPYKIADTVSHELGHTFGLAHDGYYTDEYYAKNTTWAPLMGGGIEPILTQWSDGNYEGHTQTTDEIAVIGAQLGFLTDDYTPQTVEATNIKVGAAVTGLINNRDDTDTFTFTLAKATQIAVSVKPLIAYGSNLEPSLVLTDSTSKVIAKKQAPVGGASGIYTPRGLSQTHTGMLPAGTYYVTIDGVGNPKAHGGPVSDYGSLGYYRVTVTKVKK
jgi:hypothetical protein